MYEKRTSFVDISLHAAVDDVLAIVDFRCAADGCAEDARCAMPPTDELLSELCFRRSLSMSAAAITPPRMAASFYLLLLSRVQCSGDDVSGRYAMTFCHTMRALPRHNDAGFRRCG